MILRLYDPDPQRMMEIFALCLLVAILVRLL